MFDRKARFTAVCARSIIDCQSVDTGSDSSLNVNCNLVQAMQPSWNSTSSQNGDIHTYLRDVWRSNAKCLAQSPAHDMCSIKGLLVVMLVTDISRAHDFSWLSFLSRYMFPLREEQSCTSLWLMKWKQKR